MGSGCRVRLRGELGVPAGQVRVGCASSLPCVPSSLPTHSMTADTVLSI